jgi:hypothetical protein
VASVERRAQLVGEDDPGHIVAGRDDEEVAPVDAEGVRRVHAGIGSACMQRGPQGDGRAGLGVARAAGLLVRLREAREAALHARTQAEMVRVTRDRAGGRQLHRRAAACLPDVVDRIAGGLVAGADGCAGVEAVVDVAVQHGRAQRAVEGVRLEQQLRREATARVGVDEHELVGLVVGPGVRLAPVRQPGERQGLVAFEARVGQRHAEVGAIRAVAPADLAEGLRDAAGIMPAPAALVQRAGGAEGGQARIVGAALHVDGRAAPHAAMGAHLAAVLLEAVAGRHGERAAQRVQAEHRVRAGDHRDLGDRAGRDQVPVDGVAEGLVDAHPVDEHRQPLRRAQRGRGREAPEVDVQLVRVAGGVVDVDAADAPVQRLRERGGAHRGECVAAQRLHVGGHLRQGRGGTGQHRGRHHGHGLHRGHLRRFVRPRSAVPDRQRQHEKPERAARPHGQPGFLENALHQPVAETCLRPNMAQPPQASVALPCQNAHSTQRCCAVWFGYFFVSVCVVSWW